MCDSVVQEPPHRCYEHLHPESFIQKYRLPVNVFLFHRTRLASSSVQASILEHRSKFVVVLFASHHCLQHSLLHFFHGRHHGFTVHVGRGECTENM